jgi:hypothetical protein
MCNDSGGIHRKSHCENLFFFFISPFTVVIDFSSVSSSLVPYLLPSFFFNSPFSVVSDLSSVPRLWSVT